MHPTPRWFHRVTLAIAILTAVASTWPIAAHLSDHVIDGAALIAPNRKESFAAANIGADVITTVWIVNWILHALITQPLHPWDANIFYPTPLAGARQEHLFATDLLGAPGALLVGPVFAHQSALLLCIILNFWGAAYVVARWTGSLVGGLVAGVLFAVSVFHQLQIFHLQSLGTCYFPLIVLALERFGAEGKPKWAGLVAVALALQVMSGQYLGYMAMVVAVVVGLVALLAGRPAERPLVRLLHDAGWLAVAALASVILTLPFILPYFRLMSTGDIPDNSAVALNRLFDLRGYLLGPHFTWHGLPAGAWLLATVGALTLLRDRPGRVRVVMLLLVGWLGAQLSLGRITIGFDAWGTLASMVPGFGSMREPVRFMLLPCLAMALLGGVGSAALVGWMPRAGGVVALVLCGWAAAHAWRGGLPLREVPVGDKVPQEYRLLARCGDGDPLVEVPLGMAVDNFRDAEPQLMSVYHWLPLLNGRASYSPPEMERTRTLVNVEMLKPNALAELRQRTGVRWVLVHCDPSRFHPVSQQLCGRVAWRDVPSRYFVGSGSILFDLGRVDVLPRPVKRRVLPTEGCLTATG
jgi:hypothetical protein